MKSQDILSVFIDPLRNLIGLKKFPIFSSQADYTRGLIDWIAPPLCPLCGNACEKTLCSDCFATLSFLTYEQRCLKCFFPLDEETHLCDLCLRERPFFHRAAAVFSHEGAAKCLKNEKLIASFFVLQWARLNWPMPDEVVAVPSHPLFKKSTELIAKEVALLLCTPLVPCLKLRLLSLPQEGKSLKDRRKKDPDDFIGSRRSGKVILLIDDRMVSRGTFSAASCILKARVYCLAFTAEDYI